MHARKHPMDGARPAIHGSARGSWIAVDCAQARPHSWRGAKEGVEARHTAGQRYAGAVYVPGVRSHAAGKATRRDVPALRAHRIARPGEGGGRGSRAQARGGSFPRQGARAGSPAVVLRCVEGTRGSAAPRSRGNARFLHGCGHRGYDSRRFGELCHEFRDRPRGSGGRIVAYREGSWMVEPGRRLWPGLTVPQFAGCAAFVVALLLGVRLLSEAAYLLFTMTGFAGW